MAWLSPGVAQPSCIEFGNVSIKGNVRSVKFPNSKFDFDELEKDDLLKVLS